MKVLWFLLPPLLFLSSGALSARAGAENPTASAEGKVVDEAGLPFQGARVELHLIEREPDPSHADSGLYQTTSGPDGLFRISGLPADSWFTLRIARTGFTALVQRGIASSPEGGKVVLGTFRLPKGQTVAGRVVDSKGHPLAGAQVWARSEKDEDLMGHPSWHAADGPAAVTGPDGRYEIHGFEPGSLEVCREGFSPHEASAESSRPSRVVLLPFPLPSRITGRVVDDRGLPITKAKIQLSYFDNPWKILDVPRWLSCPQRILDGSDMVDPEKLVTLSDRKGRFTFELAGEETMQVEAEAAGYLRRADLKVSLSPRSPKKVEIVLERGAIVSGRVLTTDGLPAASAEISFPEGRNGLTTPAGTDGEGRYRIAGIEPGNQTMEVKHPSGQASSKLSIAPGENRRPDLILDGNGLREILGRVTGPDGEPIASASIRRIVSPLALVKNVSTAADGSFRLSFRRSLTDEIEIDIQKAGYANRKVRLDPAQPDLSSLAIRLDPEVRLTGHILGVDPASLPDVEVEARQGDLRHQSMVSRDGEYRIAGLGPGDFAVRASLIINLEIRCGDARAALETGTEAILDLVIPSKPRFSRVEVRGKILGPDGAPVAGTVRFEAVKGSPACVADFASYADVEDDGSFLAEIPPGRYTMTGEMPGYARTVQEQILTIANDPVENLEVRLKPESRPSGPQPP